VLNVTTQFIYKKGRTDITFKDFTLLRKAKSKIEKMQKAVGRELNLLNVWPNKGYVYILQLHVFLGFPTDEAYVSSVNRSTFIFSIHLNTCHYVHIPSLIHFSAKHHKLGAHPAPHFTQLFNFFYFPFSQKG